MDAFEISQLILDRLYSGCSYLDLLRIPTLNAEIYNLPANGVDYQKPHQEDEVYYIVDGRGSIRVGTEDRTVEPGTIVFIAAEVEYFFHTVTDDLKVLIFSPAKSEKNEEYITSKGCIILKTDDTCRYLVST